MNNDYVKFLTKYNTNKSSIREKRQIEDLLVYKKNIVFLRNNFYDNSCSLITYIKKTTQQVKQYQIQLHTYYYNRDKKQIILIAKDVNSDKNYTKTFILNNVFKVEKSNRKVQSKNLLIN